MVILKNLQAHFLISLFAFSSCAVAQDGYNVGVNGYNVSGSLPLIARSKYLDSKNFSQLNGECFRTLRETIKQCQSDDALVDYLKSEIERLRKENETLRGYTPKEVKSTYRLP